MENAWVFPSISNIMGKGNKMFEWGKPKKLVPIQFP